jgi:integrase
MRALKLFIQHVGGHIRLREVSPRHAESFIASRLRQKLAPATVNKDIRTLKRVFNLAIHPREYLLQGSNPFRSVKPRKHAEKPKRFVAPEEFRALMNAAENDWWRALLTVAYATGLRRGEILNLTWNDIDFAGHCVRVSPKNNTDQLLAWEPKDHECRIIPAPHQVMPLLADLRAGSEEECPYPFLGKRRWSRILWQRRQGNWRDDKTLVNNVDRKFRALRTKAGVAHCTLHDLRRSCITNWACELPAHVVQKLAGHSDIKTTQKYYLIVRQEDLERARNVMSRVLGNDETHPASKAQSIAANPISRKVEGDN